MDQQSIQRLNEMDQRAFQAGGPERLEKQKKQGKLTARERIDRLLDPGSFVEMDRFVTHRCIDFGMEKQMIPGDCRRGNDSR
jgi:acetyl-CoA carboxylase carboxyltransferase component